MLKRRMFLAGTTATLVGGAFGAFALIAPKEPGLTTLSGTTMGTYFRIVFPDRMGVARTISSSATALLSELDGLMSTYKSDSEVSLFNAAALGLPIHFSPHTIAVVEKAHEIGIATGGAFDPTIGPLVDLWGFGASAPALGIPSHSNVAKTAGRIGMDALQIDQRSGWKTRDNLSVDLNGIAKGYAVDQLAALLNAQGVSDYLVDIGGELRAKGCKPDGDLWRVGIERPDAASPQIQSVVALDGQAIATSGDYRQFFVRNGRTYSHVIDPRTAEPVSHSLASVSVLARDTVTADALSTALMVMGLRGGFDFAKRNDIAAYFVERREHGLTNQFTPAFAPHLQAVA